ncbi:MAG: carboxypeptidase regulatory-like domain-containing protein, partial [Acidobacteriota bacterium]|nr:carboxypeptidase regulatory-like domain-containing protein [Acidobacteriota bacterium]
MRLSRLSPLLLILAAGIPVLAQGTQTSTITMEVVDAKGHPVAGALVRVTSPALQGERQGRTDSAGRYRAPMLPPGDYRLIINKSGLETVTINQHLGLEQTFSPRVVMRDTTGATIEVVSSSITADKSEFKSAESFSKEKIDALPVNRSSLLDIAYLAPGVVENQNSDRGEVQIRGSMGTGNVFLVDGQNVNDNLYEGQRIGIIFDSVDETMVLTGALPAEYGDVEGGVVNSVTKSGSDQFEGSIRWDLADPSWNATTPLSDRSSYASNLSSQRSVQLGGPIIKGRLWFHAAYFDTHPHEVKTIASDQYFNSATGTYYLGTGYSYQAPTDDYRREYKLTAALTDNQNLSASYHNYHSYSLADYGAGEPAALTGLLQIGNFW